MKQGMENMNRSKMIRDNRLIGIQQETLADRVMGRKGAYRSAGVYAALYSSALGGRHVSDCHAPGVWVF